MPRIEGGCQGISGLGGPSDRARPDPGLRSAIESFTSFFEVSDFRYPQFCAIARASEILGERWTLPIVRELFVGPQRFTDLLRRLPGLSSSVLAARLDRLARAGVVAQRALPPPAASLVYELTENGRALQPVLRELLRWGLRYLGPPARGDHFEPEWPVLALEVMARRDAAPRRRFELVLPRRGGEAVTLHCEGGRDGVHVGRGPASGPVDLRVEAPPLVLLGFVGGALAPEQVSAHPQVTLTGDARALPDLPLLFELANPNTEE